MNFVAIVNELKTKYGMVGLVFGGCGRSTHQRAQSHQRRQPEPQQVQASDLGDFQVRRSD